MRLVCCALVDLTPEYWGTSGTVLAIRQSLGGRCVPVSCARATIPHPQELERLPLKRVGAATALGDPLSG